MKGRGVLLGGVAAILVVVLWWMFVFSGIRNDTSDVDEEIDAARREESSLRARLAALEEIEAQEPEIAAQLADLQNALPEYPDLAEFITEANAIKDAAGVDWVSISPTEPTLVGSIGEIKMTIAIEGGYFQVLDYLNRLEEIDRLVIVDGITLTSGSGDASDGDATGGDSFVGGAPSLSANLTARMFTLSASTVDPPASATDDAAGGDGATGDETTTTLVEG